MKQKVSSRRRLMQIAAALGLGLLLSGVVIELGLRWLLFGESALALRLGARLRRASYYADGNHHDDYWKLHHLWAEPARRIAVSNPDPLLGWTGYAVRSGSYEQRDADRVGDRRPVLLYGDSFAQCNTPPEECFQAVLEDSDLARDYALVNYGVGGYGLDQIYLLLKHSIEAWRDRDPIVIVSLLVENDLDRSVLSFRDWPKPRLTLDAGRLVEPAAVETDVVRYLGEHPVRIRSFLLRLLAYKRGMLPSRVQGWLRERLARHDEKLALNRLILIEIANELRGLPHAILLFHADGALGLPERANWREPFVEELCAELGMPSISTRSFLVDAAGGDANRAGIYYGHSGRLDGHLNAAGNVVVFEAIRETIEGLAAGRAPDAGRARRVDPSLLPERFEIRTRETLLGRSAEVIERGAGRLVRLVRVEQQESGTRLHLRAGELGSTVLTLQTEERDRRLRGRAVLVLPPGSSCAPLAATLSIEVVGRAGWSLQLAPGRAPQEIDVPLEGGCTLRLTASYPGPDPDCAWIRIEDARIEQ